MELKMGSTYQHCFLLWQRGNENQTLAVSYRFLCLIAGMVCGDNASPVLGEGSAAGLTSDVSILSPLNSTRASVSASSGLSRGQAF